MMEYALKKFKNRIDFIKKQLYAQGLAKELRGIFENKNLSEKENGLLNEILDNKTDEKIYQYTANVILLYGGLESFVEAIAEEYLNGISSLFPSYNALKCATGISDYMLSGISLLHHAEDRKFKNLAKKDVLKGLYRAIINDDSSMLQSEAFIDFGGGNYRHEAIMRCFSQLGVKEMSGRLKSFEPMKGFIDEKGIDASSNIYTKVDDLVERRNELAHGTEAPELMDSESFSEYISFFLTYAETINNYLNNEIKSFSWKLAKCEALVPRVFSNNVISLNADPLMVGTELIKGQKLLILHNGQYYDGEIVNIRVNNTDYEHYIIEEDGLDIGLHICSVCSISKNNQIKILSNNIASS